MQVQAIITIPPYADFLAEVAKHPLVYGFRLNTIMPVIEDLPDLLNRLAGYGKPLWVDLKGRQLRVIGAAIPPFTEIQLSHDISVRTPVDAYFSDGMECARVVAAANNRLILEDSPRRMVGPGESVNIIHPSLKISGTLTESDIAYLKAMVAIGLKTVMLSYVEKIEDAQEIMNLLPEADLILKIESQKGLDFCRVNSTKYGRLMAARGDLFIEVGKPHKIVSALREIITADPDAIVASRIFDSLAEHPVPSNADIGDAAYLLSLGYRTFMFGDMVCLHGETVLAGLNLLGAVASEFL